MNEQTKKVVQQALEVLKRCQMNEAYRNFEQESHTITALQQLLEAEPVQEPLPDAVQWYGGVKSDEELVPPEAQPSPVRGFVKKIEDLIQERDDALKSREFYKRRCDALQKWQSKMRDPERTIVCDILANGRTLEPAGDRYTTPPTQGENR